MRFQAPLLSPFFSHSSPLFPLQAVSPLSARFPSSPPLYPPFFDSQKTLICSPMIATLYLVSCSKQMTPASCVSSACSLINRRRDAIPSGSKPARTVAPAHQNVGARAFALTTYNKLADNIGHVLSGPVEIEPPIARIRAVGVAKPLSHYWALRCSRVSRSYQGLVIPLLHGEKAAKTLVLLYLGAVREGRRIHD